MYIVLGKEGKVVKLSAIGVTPEKERQFSKKGIYTVEDLLEFIPIRYMDFRRETGVLPEDQLSCIVVKLYDFTVHTEKRPGYVLGKGKISATGENISVYWFNRTFMYSQLSQHRTFPMFVVGKVKRSILTGEYTIMTPIVYEPAHKGKRIYPVYSKIPGMSDEYLCEKIDRAFDTPSIIKDRLPENVIRQNDLMLRQTALYRLHYPDSMESIKKAKDRLIFDELLDYAIKNEVISRESSVGSPYQIKSLSLFNKIKRRLPYHLTADQEQAIQDMQEDVKQGKRLNALIQGDVGCGKTIVAFLMMASFVSGGDQVALMAPTQVLAKQHYEDLSALVVPLGYQVAYMSGEQTPKQREQVKNRIADGSVNFIVGTSAVIGKDVSYKKLVLTVTDEEHRFGVLQREGLMQKASDGVHTLTMSATPIPRSLAQVIYGNRVQLHTIRSKPNGRKPVITGLQTDPQRVFRFIRTQVQKYGHQVYVVCPMIDSSEKTHGVKSVEDVDKLYHKIFDPFGVKIATLTGKDKKGVAERTVLAFKNGEIDILIATTVIEVGVNVPNATAIVITNAERFGLSTLHQLRGRVGRSDVQSFCILQCSKDITEQGKRRLEVMCQTADGFKIAEEDLRMRGAGDPLGTNQSGENHYINLMLAYPVWYEEVKKIAIKIVDNI